MHSTLDKSLAKSIKNTLTYYNDFENGAPQPDEYGAATSEIYEYVTLQHMYANMYGTQNFAAILREYAEQMDRGEEPKSENSKSRLVASICIVLLVILLFLIVMVAMGLLATRLSK